MAEHDIVYEPVAYCKYCGALAAHSTARECETGHETRRDIWFKRRQWWYWDRWKLLSRLEGWAHQLGWALHEKKVRQP